MSDDLIVRLKDGVVEREKRWQGDTHDDLGGWVDYEATDNLMAEAAARIADLERQLEAARVLAGEVGRVANLLLCSGSNTAMTVALIAALSAYQESKK